MNLEIFFLTYNEGESIVKVLENAKRHVETRKLDAKITVIDNASTDNTREFAKKVAGVGLIAHEKNMGYAYSVKEALEVSKAGVIAVIDGDGQNEVRDLDGALRLVGQGFDVIIGSRIVRMDPWHRNLLSVGHNIIFRMLFDTRLDDIDCGFKVFTSTAAKKIRIEYTDLIVGPELVVRSMEQGLKVTQVKVTHYKREKGSSMFGVGKLLAIIPKILFRYLVLRLRFKKAKSPA
ncbi:glycosyltransferase family 2 protein [Candidatus Parvarchaeota archaeon]|nr:glycosyltransferase family 2 protein [Candidatus Parvarchaeota archaeon]